MNKSLSHIAARVFNTPLLLEPKYARVFFNALSSKFSIQEMHDADGMIELRSEVMEAEAANFKSSNRVWRTEGDPYQLIDGVAVIPVSGTLVHKNEYLYTFSGMTGYDGIIARATHAFSNPMVKGVLLDNDTPGGEVAGCFDAARKLRKLASESGKPLWASCYEMNCSAGMAIASAADRRLITQTGMAGSVGVLMAHVSWEKYLAEEGIAVTLIHSGMHKVEGNPYENLEQAVIDKFTAETNQLRNEFAELVGTMMGMDTSQVLQTEAEVYRGSDAIDIGFADELVNGNEAIDHFVEHLSSRGRTTSIGGGTSMKNQVKTDTAQPESGAASEAEAQAAATTEQPAAGGGANTQAADQAKVKQDASVEERGRIQGILHCEEAKGKTELAEHLAFKTQMSVEEAKNTLAATPAASTGLNTPLDAAMTKTDQPEAGADSGEGSDTSQAVSRMMKNYQKATGQKPAQQPQQ